MEFGVGPDLGHHIRAWILPPNPSDHPTILVDVDGAVRRVQANVQHQDQVDAGRSTSGYCGFSLSNENVPGLSTATHVTIVDEESGLTIFRRRERRLYADARLYVFEARPPEESLAMSLFAPAFQMAQAGIDILPRETRRAYIHNIALLTPSVLVSGSNFLRAEEGLLRNKEYRLAALLTDPAQLLFEALMPEDALNDPDSLGLFARELRHLNEAEKTAISNPLTRRLTLIAPEMPMRRDAVASALVTLSELDAVGVEVALPDFVSLVAAVTQMDESLFARPAPVPPFPFAAALRQDPMLRQLIGMDIDIYDAVADAILETRPSAAPLNVVPTL